MIDKNVDYDKEDLELLEEMKNSEFVSMEKEDPKGYAKFKKELQKAAKNHLETKKMISLRLARQDINKVKEMAAEE
ncbi:MAG: hypothetical protein LBF15_00915 [Candidatus Peribacteria bacterium]|jgi:predicted DNA binding CopG/RHH family protein|nr:hypothetical protein [Candidatus Peribacteria bacterium]